MGENIDILKRGGGAKESVIFPKLVDLNISFLPLCYTS